MTKKLIANIFIAFHSREKQKMKFFKYQSPGSRQVSSKSAEKSGCRPV
jgi:hypothetical protein